MKYALFTSPFFGRFYLLLLIISVFLHSCKCDDPSNPECRNYDPVCDDIEIISAEFMMWESLGNTDSVEVVTGKIRYNRRVTLVARQNNLDSYKWKMNDSLISEKSVAVIQFAYPASGDYTFTLEVMSDPNNYCYPDDDGLDEVSKQITLVSINEAPILGSYWGADAHTPDEPYRLDIGLAESSPGLIISIIEKFPSECDTDVRGIFMSGNGFGENPENPGSGIFCQGIQSKGYLVSADTLRIEYRIDPGNAPAGTSPLERTFTGVRQ